MYLNRRVFVMKVLDQALKAYIPNRNFLSVIIYSTLFNDSICGQRRSAYNTISHGAALLMYHKSAR